MRPYINGIGRGRSVTCPPFSDLTAPCDNARRFYFMEKYIPPLPLLGSIPQTRSGAGSSVNTCFTTQPLIVAPGKAKVSNFGSKEIKVRELINWLSESASNTVSSSLYAPSDGP